MLVGKQIRTERVSEVIGIPKAYFGGPLRQAELNRSTRPNAPAVVEIHVLALWPSALRSSSLAFEPFYKAGINISKFCLILSKICCFEY